MNNGQVMKLHTALTIGPRWYVLSWSKVGQGSKLQGRFKGKLWLLVPPLATRDIFGCHTSCNYMANNRPRALTRVGENINFYMIW